MARCEGTTQAGEQCKREAQEGSRFCYIHDREGEELEKPEAEAADFDDLLPILIAGAATLAFVLVFKSLGRLFPRL